MQRLLRVGTWGQSLAHDPDDGQPQRLVHEFHVRPGQGDDASEQAQRWIAFAHPSLHDVIHAEVTQPPGSPAQILRVERSMPRGTPLAQVLVRTGPVEELAVMALFVDLARGLQEAHAAGLVVGNLSAETVVVAAPGTDNVPPLLAVDAGGYSLLVAATGQTLQAETPGFAQWLPVAESLAPEVLAGGTPTAASDVFALAAVMGHALLGHPVFAAPTTAVLRAQMATGVATDTVAELVHKAPHMGGVIVKALAPQGWGRSGALADLVARMSKGTQALPVLTAEGRSVLDPWVAGSPLIPLAAYASSVPWSAQFAETQVVSGAPTLTPASVQDKAKLRLALDQLEMAQVRSRQRAETAGRNILTRLILIVLFALIAAAIAATAMRDAQRAADLIHPPRPADTAAPKPLKPPPVPRVLFETPAQNGR